MNCGKTFKIPRRYVQQVFCSRTCRNKFYHRQVPHCEVLALAKQVEELKDKCTMTQALLAAQQKTTDEFAEANQQLRTRLKELDTVSHSGAAEFENSKEWISRKLFGQLRGVK